MQPSTIGLTLAIVFWVILAGMSLAGCTVAPPAPWLEAWTKWIAAVVGIVVSARVLWAGGAFLARRRG